MRNHPATTSKTYNGAVFLDRDGTIIEEVNYLSRLEDIRLLPRAAAAIARLNRRKIPVILVSNQSGVARGRFDEAFVRTCHKQLQEMLRRDGAHIDDFYFCPHHPEAGSPPYRRTCNCRKPAPGMLYEAARKHHLDLHRSFVIGDKLSDLELARNAGARGILVLTGYGHSEKSNVAQRGLRPAAVCADLDEAVTWLLPHINESGRDREAC